jgi:hypothetical protein
MLVQSTIIIIITRLIDLRVARMFQAPPAGSNENYSLPSLVLDNMSLSLGHSNIDYLYAPKDKAYYHAQPSFYAHCGPG